MTWNLGPMVGWLHNNDCNLVKIFQKTIIGPMFDPINGYNVGPIIIQGTLATWDCAGNVGLFYTTDAPIPGNIKTLNQWWYNVVTLLFNWYLGEAHCLKPLTILYSNHVKVQCWTNNRPMMLNFLEISLKSYISMN